MKPRTLAATALLLALTGCGSEPPEGPVAKGPDPTASASASVPVQQLPGFSMPERGDPMRPSEPPEFVASKQGAMEFATYYESLTADGLAPPVGELVAKSASSSCEACETSLAFVRTFNADKLTMVPRRPTTFTGLVDAFQDKQGWHVTLEYALKGARSVNTSGKTVQTYAPARFVKSVVTLAPRASSWLVTGKSVKYLDASMVGAPQ